MLYIYVDNIVVLWRLWSSLAWTTLSLCYFTLHCGLADTVVERLQRYNCIWLTYIVNVEQNILFNIDVWSCEMLSLCGKLIWRVNVVFGQCFVFRRRLYRESFMNHFVLEKLVTSLTNELVIYVWMRTSLNWELLEVFRLFWICVGNKLVCRLVAAGIVSTNLYLKNLRFVNWKPEIEFTSWDIGSRELCVRSSCNEGKLLCHLTWHETDQLREHYLPVFACCCFVCCVCVSFDWSCCVWSEKKESDVSMWESFNVLVSFMFYGVLAHLMFIWNILDQAWLQSSVAFCICFLLLKNPPIPHLICFVALVEYSVLYVAVLPLQIP